MTPPAGTPGGPDAGSVLVARIGPEDWQRLREIRLEALAESPEAFGSTEARERGFDAAEWRRRAARPATFVACRGGADVGMAGVYEVDGTWYVMGMWVAPGARGTGVLEALVDACESQAQRAGAATVALWVMEDNPRARRGYARLGYRTTGTSDECRDGRDELLMVRTLAEGTSPST